MTQIVDFRASLREAIREARAAGLTDAATELEARAFAAYATASEWLGEVGAAIHEFLAREGEKVPESVTRRLDECLTEVAKVWPDLQRKWR